MGTGKASELIVRIVPGLNAEQDAEGRIFEATVTHGRVELLRREEHFSLIGKVLHDRSAQVHFASALSDSFSHFQSGEASEFFLFFQKNLSRPANDLRALTERTRCPGSKCFVRGGQCIPHLLIGMFRKGLEYFSGCWVDATVWQSWLLRISNRFPKLPADTNVHESCQVGALPGELVNG